jgi:hypothetical protein
MSDSPPTASLHHPARMGLEPLPLADWLKPQPSDEALLAVRARLIADYASDVMAALPEADAAVAELANLLKQRGTEIDGGNGVHRTLAALGQAIAEDLCILTPEENAYRLTAGVLCFPNRWRLTEKIGGNVLAVHGPVPDYSGALAQAVDRFLTRLKPARAYLRRNWGLSTSQELYLPTPTPAVDPRSDAPMFFRREDQSFLKLPETGAVIFAIRTTVTPWRETPDELRSEILATIDGLSRPWLDYKSIKPYLGSE